MFQLVTASTPIEAFLFQGPFVHALLDALTKLRQLQSPTGKSVNAIIAEHFGETANKGISCNFSKTPGEANFQAVY